MGEIGLIVPGFPSHAFGPSYRKVGFVNEHCKANDVSLEKFLSLFPHPSLTSFLSLGIDFPACVQDARFFKPQEKSIMPLQRRANISSVVFAWTVSNAFAFFTASPLARFTGTIRDLRPCLVSLTQRTRGPGNPDRKIWVTRIQRLFRNLLSIFHRKRNKLFFRDLFCLTKSPEVPEILIIHERNIKKSIHAIANLNFSPSLSPMAVARVRTEKVNREGVTK